MGIEKGQLNNRRQEFNPGDKYGEWTVIEEVERRTDNQGNKIRQVKCQCSCGKIRTVLAASLTKKNNPSRSCGHSADYAFSMFKIHEYEKEQGIIDRIESFVSEHELDDSIKTEEVLRFLDDIEGELHGIKDDTELRQLIDPETGEKVYLDKTSNQIIKKEE